MHEKVSKPKSAGPNESNEGGGRFLLEAMEWVGGEGE